MAVAVALSSFAGCAFTTDTIPLGYQTQTWGRRIQGAEQVNVQVVVHDQRRDQTRVGCKKNGYGSEMAAIVADSDVGDFVQGHIQEEMTRRGFKAGPSGVVIDVSLRKFYNDFKTGFFTGDAQAEIVMDVRAFKRAPGTAPAPLYYGHFEGQGVNKNIGMYTGDNAKIALDAAFADVMRTLMSDRQLMTALLQSMTPPPPPPPSPAAAPAS